MREAIRENRFMLFLLAIMLLLACVPAAVLRANAADDVNSARFEFNAANPGPRDLEEQTQSAIKRQYAAAWANMTEALDQNRTDKLGHSFVGSALEQLKRRVDQQQKNGLSSKLADKTHHIDIAFYSPEGTAIELRDTVDIEQQTMDGSKSVSSDNRKQKYVVIFTLVEDKWKVRTLQEVE
jgi:hypothetical protein